MVNATIKHFLVLISIPLVGGIGVALWYTTRFFHSELLHQELMALGDVREPTLSERLWLGAVWIPFGIFMLGVIAFYGTAILSILLIQRSDVPNKDA